MQSLLQTISVAPTRTVVVLIAVAALAAVDVAARIRHKPSHYVFACITGSVLAVGLMKAMALLGTPGLGSDPYAVTLAIFLIILGWRALFGQWETTTKATVLGVFIFWMTFASFIHQSPQERLVHAIAGGVALIPAAAWCILFLRYHKERISAVILLFFAGMLSTLPILFYDAIVRRGVVLDLFLMRVEPMNFHQAVSELMRTYTGKTEGLLIMSITSLCTFMIVGCIEEMSKLWVLSRSGRRLFSSIDDVMELAIIAAIGFAFAENIVNPLYFRSFVEQYLMGTEGIDIAGFLASVMGRSVLTSMLHILATGVAGYFLGLAVFANSYLADCEEMGRKHRLLSLLQRVLGLDRTLLFRRSCIVVGLFFGILLHGTFNFSVTLPDIMPGQPRTLADLLGYGSESPLRWVPLLLFPALLYVVGGFWLLTWLFMRKTNSKERGRPFVREVFVDKAEST